MGILMLLFGFSEIMRGAGQDPLSLMKADPSDARLLGMNAAARRAAAGRGDGLLWPVSLFGERAVSSPRPTFQTARRAASVKRGAEQPGATRSAL